MFDELLTTLKTKDSLVAQLMIRRSFDSAMRYDVSHPWSLIAYNENEGILKRERYTDLFITLNMAEKTNLSIVEFFDMPVSEADSLIDRFIRLAEAEAAKPKTPK